MAGQQLRALMFALSAGAAIAAAQAAEKDVLGWEGARWGMSEIDVKKVFRAKTVVALTAEQPNQTRLSIPGYVFLGCPFDVTFLFARSQGLVRIDLTQVEELAGHGAKSAGEYQKACEFVDRQLVDKFGPAQEHRYEKRWKFPSADVSTGGARMGQVYVTFERRLDGKPRDTELLKPPTRRRS
jgi:hypothetical protein